MDKKSMTEALTQKKERLKLYLDREKYLLSPDAVQSYGVGSRNLQRYRTDLSDIQRQITSLENEIKDLENLLKGSRPRKSVVIIPRDL